MVPDPLYRFSVLQVIWVLGWSMIVLAAFVGLPRAAALAFGGALVLGHNLLDGVHADGFGGGAWLWAVLHEQRMLEPLPGHRLFVIYPLVPWMGVMALGFAFGAVVRLPPQRRRAIYLRLGGALCAAFVLLRALDRYGDPHPWSVQPSALFTLLSFVNTTKYPPSLDYLLMTLGPALIALALAPGGTGAITRALVTFGQAPLFFYVAHVYLLRYASLPFGYLRFGARAFLAPPDGGTMGSPEWPLAATYLAWAAAVLLLYPACRWYAALKRTSRHPVIRYL
jgi:uncharacterized membrane protein